jgi:hypothetical protein
MSSCQLNALHVTIRAIETGRPGEGMGDVRCAKQKEEGTDQRDGMAMQKLTMRKTREHDFYKVNRDDRIRISEIGMGKCHCGKSQ